MIIVEGAVGPTRRRHDEASEISFTDCFRPVRGRGNSRRMRGEQVLQTWFFDRSDVAVDLVDETGIGIEADDGVTFGGQDCNNRGAELAQANDGNFHSW